MPAVCSTCPERAVCSAVCPGRHASAAFTEQGAAAAAAALASTANGFGASAAVKTIFSIVKLKSPLAFVRNPK